MYYYLETIYTLKYSVLAFILRAVPQKKYPDVKNIRQSTKISLDCSIMLLPDGLSYQNY